MLALALVAVLQSDVDRWIADLGADDVETRDAAEKKLIERRARDAVTKALASDDAEVRARAERIIRQIEDDVEVEAFMAVPKVSAAYDKKALAAVLKDWSKSAGVKLFCDALPETPVTLSFKDVPLPEALDRLCASLMRVTWDASDSARIRVWSAEALSKPAAYVGPVRVLLMWPKNRRFFLMTQCFKAPLPEAKMSITGARSRGGAKVEISAERNSWFSASTEEAEIVDVEGNFEVELFVGAADVALREEMLGKPFDVGEVTIQLQEWTDGFASFTLTRPESRDESARVIGGVMEIIDHEGRTTRGTLGYDNSRARFDAEAPPVCVATFPEEGSVDEVRFKLKPRTKRLQLPFKIDRIEFGK